MCLYNSGGGEEKKKKGKRSINLSPIFLSRIFHLPYLNKQGRSQWKSTG